MFKSRRTRALPNLETLAFERLPWLTSDQLLTSLEQYNRLRSIQRIVGIDAARFDSLYLAPIHRFCELAQLAPASVDYHHTSPGGLIAHTLSMVDYAVHERRKYNLPLRSDPEIQQREKHVWTYAVFVGALLHDIGKLVTLCQFVSNRAIISPYDSKAVDDYAIRFIKSPYKLHQYLSMSFYQLIPTAGQAFIANHIHVLEELTGYFNEDPYSWGSIGEIIRQADQRSVAENLKLSGQKRFPSALNLPLHERLITALRQIIRLGELPVNRAGAAIWVKHGYAYLLVPRVPDTIRDYLKINGAEDIPSDNLRLFDTLQQFGFIEPTMSNRAVWRINVRQADGFNQSFTAIKISVNRIFHPNALPKDLEGAIIEEEAPTNTEAELTGTEDAHNDTITQPQDANTHAGAAEQSSETTIESDEPQEFQLTLPTGADSQSGDMEPSKDLGLEFIDWLKSSIESKNIRLNEDQEIHIVNYKTRGGDVVKKAGVISPAAFGKFAKTKGMTGNKDFEVIQKAVHKTKLPVKNGRYHIHQYRIKNATSSKAILRLYLFDIETLMPDGMDPRVNESLVFTK